MLRRQDQRTRSGVDGRRKRRRSGQRQGKRDVGAPLQAAGFLDSPRWPWGYSSRGRKGESFMRIRKLVVYAEELGHEGGRAGEHPGELSGAAAGIATPWAGMGYVEDLMPTIEEMVPELGQILVGTLMETVGSGDRVEAFGKAAVVGTAGEIEHAAAMIQTLKFGNVFREAVGGTSVLASTN